MKIVTYAEYGEDDAEPEEVMSVTDSEGDIWYRIGGGQWHLPRADAVEPWATLAHDFGPLRVEAPNGRHDSDCQAFQHTYVADQGEPGVYRHGPGDPRQFADAVGSNGRRLLVRQEADGVYVGGALFTWADTLKLAALLHDLAADHGTR